MKYFLITRTGKLSLEINNGCRTDEQLFADYGYTMLDSPYDDITINDFDGMTFNQAKYNNRKAIESKAIHNTKITAYIRSKYSLNQELAIMANYMECQDNPNCAKREEHMQEHNDFQATRTEAKRLAEQQSNSSQQFEM